MKTSVKVPHFLERFLNVYAVITVGIGFVIIALVNSPHIKSLNKKVNAFPPEVMAGCWTSGYPNPWGSGEWGDPRWMVGSYEVVGNSYIEIPEGVYTISTNARWHTDGGSPASITAFAGLYTPPFGGPLVAQSGTQTFTVNPGADGATNSWSFSYDFNGKCYDYQIDFSDPSAPWDSRCGAIFRIVGCEEPPPPPPPPPSDQCPYDSTQARVQEDIDHAWDGQITIYEGESFRIGSFHDQTGTFSSDTEIAVEDPNGAIIHTCDTSDPGCNGATIAATIVGTYVVKVRTYNSGGGFYLEDECEDIASVIVQQVPPGPNPGIDIIKEVDGKSQYGRFEIVKFNITITNTGDVAFDYVHFIDQYDPSYLEFRDIAGNRYSTSGTFIQGGNLKHAASVSGGTITIENLATNDLLGSLGVGEKYVLTVEFVTKDVVGTVQTKNIAIVSTETEYDEDEEVIVISYNPPPPPPTDK